jgi:hypothetical protein
MFKKVEIVTDHGISKTANCRIVGLTTDGVKVNLYHKNGRVGIDVFKLDPTVHHKKWNAVYSEWGGLNE